MEIAISPPPLMFCYVVCFYVFSELFILNPVLIFAALGALFVWKGNKEMF